MPEQAKRYSGRVKRKPPGEATRPNAAQRGYGGAWQRARELYLMAHPLCAKCEARGETRAADVVDHIIPHRGDKAIFWDRNNWAALCYRCHNSKTGKGL